MIGTTAAIIGTLIGAGASTAASIVSSNKQADAATQAAKVQTDAANQAAQLQAQTADKSLALQKYMYDTGVANMTPYNTTGQAAGSKLAGMLGVSIPKSTATTGAATGTMGASTSSPSLGSMLTSNASTVATPNYIPALDQSNTSSPYAAATTPSTGQGVWMVAPDGTQKQVDPSQVAFYQSKGARILGGNTLNKVMA